MPTNMIQFIQMVKNSGNPQAFLLNMLEQQNNPFSKNIANLVKNNKKQEVEDIIRNLAREKGVDFDKEFSAFKKLIGF